ncbi:hypothetical protein [Nicoletella semolina]|nr:hypothetical protein [Nicoletella semolina]
MPSNGFVAANWKIRSKDQLDDNICITDNADKICNVTHSYGE